MNVSIFCKNVAAVVAAFCLASGSLVGAEAQKSRHQSSSSDSCCKSVKKRLHSTRDQLKRIEQLEQRLNKLAPTPITQKKIDEAGGVLLLSESGDYCVTEDITGVLSIIANSVCLDLCCHTLNADGEPNAILANGFQGLKVFDGRIINASDAAIFINNYSAVELFKLVMTSNALDSIRITNSSDLNVHDVNFHNDESGERALWFDTCNNIVVSHCNASGFFSTIGAIVQLDTCNAALVQDVDVTNNTKSQAVPSGSFVRDASLVNADTCTGVDLVRVKVNNNIVNTTAVGNRRFSAIGFSFSNSCSMHRCETSNNVDINGDVGNDLTQFSTIDFQVFIGLSDNVVITEHQANNNSCTQPIVSFRMYNNRDSNNTVFDGCQANGNSVAELAVSPIFFSEFDAFKTQVLATGVEGCVIRNCQANFNSAARGGAGRDPLIGNYAFLIGIEVAGSCLIEGCQANNNSMGDSQPLTQVIGIAGIESSSNITIRDSVADNNTGAEISVGINIFGAFGIDTFNKTVTNCSASSNQNYGFMIGNPVDTVDGPISNIEIIDSVFNRNGNAISDAAGILVLPNAVNASNILIKGCQIYDTFSGGSDAAGINVSNASNVVIEDTDVFNTTADGSGHGILFDTLTDSKIIRSQVHGNQNSGVELIGTNTNVAILDSIAIDNDKGFSVAAGSTLVHGILQGNKALGNATVGFEHAAVLPATFDTGYQKNYAQENGVNYSITNPIQIFTYSIPAATFVLVPNGATDFPTQANIAAL